MSGSIGDPDDPISNRGVFVRGVLMGIAEVVPGVSGGTVAFISGVYGRLVASLASFGAGSLPLLRTPGRFWQHHDVSFLLLLGLGMALGAVSFARVMHQLLMDFQPVVWGFFCGVILASVIVIGRQRQRGALLRYFPAGLLAGMGMVLMPVAANEPSLPELFLGGMLAVSAWLLPAISGSYLLVVLGMYETVIGALARLDLTVIGTVGLGCAVGILSFARLLSWCLHRFPEALLSLLCGFMLGSIARLWPWQLEDGAPLWQQLVSPVQYAAMLGVSALTELVVLAVLAGGGLVWWFARARSY